MDCSLFGGVRPAPASCDERGKRLKEETDLDLESEQIAEEESESESETKFEPASEEVAEKIVIRSRYHNDPYPYYFCGDPKYVLCPSLKIEEEETEKALAEYFEKADGASPFDPIPVPDKANVCGNNFPTPITLTKERLIRFKALSKRALEYYNAINQGEQNYKYVKLVKVVTQLAPLGTFYITFKAKPTKATHAGSSKRKVKTFQAHVRALNQEQPVVSCSIKIKT